MRRVMVIVAVALLAVLSAVPAGAKTNRTVEPVVGQGLGGDVAGVAELTRSNNGLHIKVEMATPEPGSYTYPDGAADDGAPEVYSLWAFVFPDPSACGDDGCGGLADVVASGGGVFAVAGHPIGGDTLVLSGHIQANTNPFMFSHLSNAAGAEVHVAVAPHGSLDPAQMPEQASTPIGMPPHWWIALFD